MIKYLQLPFHFDVKKMLKELQQMDSSAWKLHYQKLHYEGDWTALPLRSVNGDAGNIFVSPENNPEYKDTVFLEPCVYFREVLSSFKCPLLAVRLLKLNAGAVIKEHTDAELCFEMGEIRIHIPVVTNNEVEFYLDKERMNVKEGECWYMNFNLPHSVNNKSNAARIHLVVDAKVNDWVRELFSQPAIHKKEMDEPDYYKDSKEKIIVRLRQLNTETSNRLANEMEASIETTISGDMK
ncbi:MAG TPA: aspartyl/asparaginyl beta-hydroxylase domain-containing protein [Chitinophagaceae bacterium]|nr:aspartyl/asparaginyl beta-hydroxylase domain-containing protein [Chitinophagaceae bacterium]